MCMYVCMYIHIYIYYMNSYSSSLKKYPSERCFPRHSPTGELAGGAFSGGFTATGGSFRGGFFQLLIG